MGINSAKLLSAFYSTLAFAAILPGIAVNSASVLAQTGSTGTMTAPGSTAPSGTTTAPGSTAPSGTTTAPGSTTPSGTTTAPGSTAPSGAMSPQSTKLSAAQRQQIRTLVKERNAEIEGVLDQKTQLPKFNQALSSGKKVNQALQGLNLSPDQQTKIKTIMDTYREKAQAIVSQQSAPTTSPAK